MPQDEYGNKWACAPCVRGHRAMKCNHWDRFMMQVRKPGRPLTDCPHPKNQKCGCSSKNERPEYPVERIMISKDKKCLCRVLYPPSPHEEPRLDVNHIPPAPASHGPFHTPYPIPHQQVLQTCFPPASASNHLVEPSFTQGLPNGPVYLQHGQPTVGFPSHQQGSADVFALQHGIPVTTTAPNHTENLYAYSGEPRASCCSPQNMSQEKPAFQHACQNGTVEMLRDSPQTDLYRIPAGFATYNNPMKPEQQMDLGHSDPHFMQSIPAYAEGGFLGTAALPAETNDSSHSTSATMHSCSCGISCQCMACPVHPGNETTQASVQDLSQILNNDLQFLSATENDFSAWQPPSGDNETLMGDLNEDTSFFQTTFEDTGLGQRSDDLFSSMDQSSSSVLNAQYSVPTLAPDADSHSSTQALENRENGNNGVHHHAMLSQNYLHFQFPVHHSPGMHL